MGRFLAKLRLLHQGVTGGLHCIILNYEAQLCYSKDAISLNSQRQLEKTAVVKVGAYIVSIDLSSCLFTRTRVDFP